MAQRRLPSMAGVPASTPLRRGGRLELVVQQGGHETLELFAQPLEMG